MLRFVNSQGPLRSRGESKLARDILQRAGVSVFLDRLPPMVFSARDPIAAYRHWCEVMHFRDETRKSNVARKPPKVIQRSNDDLRPGAVFGLPAAARAKLSELKARMFPARSKEQTVAVPIDRAKPRRKTPKGKVIQRVFPKLAAQPKKKGKGKKKSNKSKATASDVFNRMRRLPGSAFSNQR